MVEQYDRIADGLAEAGFAIADNFLTDDEVDQIIASGYFNDHQHAFKKAGIGKSQSMQINESVRGDYIQWIDKNNSSPAIDTYMQRLDQLRGFLNQALYLSLKDAEIHKTVYPPGTFYKRHLDQFKKDDHRKLSVICYLNKDWHETDGGQLRMYLPDGHQDVFPVAGRLVCFRSDQLEHEVLPATRERMSLTGWILDQLKDM